MDSGRVSLSQEWSRVVSAEVKEEYMTLQGIQTTAHNSHLKTQRLLKSSELDTNASQACINLVFQSSESRL